MDFMKKGGWFEDQSGSSPEQARENEVMVDSPSFKKRFYECTFCKRGFTNAQALGGHMNVHRKDRQQMGSDSKRGQPSSSSRPHSSASKPRSSARETNDFHSKSIDYSFFEVQSLSPLRMNYEFLDANLSLRVGNGHVEDMDVDGVIRSDEHEEDGIDLELRLGYFHG